ncbi:MAG: MBL fold metallo-hydrolase [Tissierella sp.]|uniref:MBL fold metallo-hydrolase n=1 Tax=Tissierella sp. TaxID=41274 RepID=UPI003F956A66
MKIYRIPAGLYAANCYIIVDEDTKKSIIVDPGGNADDLLKFIKQNNLEMEYIVLTHGHADHIGAVIELKNDLNIPIMAHSDELELLNNSDQNLSSQMSIKPLEIKPSILVNDGDKFNFGNIDVEIIHTPGHTEGGISLKVGNNLFAGDTLFKGSVGRSDLHGGNSSVLINSIREKLLVLNEDTIVWPGHGDSTTIGEEKLFNPFLN